MTTAFAFQQTPNTLPARYGINTDLLRDSLRHVPGIRALVLAANDGLPVAAYGVEPAIAEKLAAESSAAISIAKGMGKDAGGGEVQHSIFHFERKVVVLSACGELDSLLVVLDATAPVGLALGEVVRQARAFAPQLASLPRVQAGLVHP